MKRQRVENLNNSKHKRLWSFMKLFEQFIAEADEMGLQSRLQSGQVNSQQARVLQQRRAARAKVSTPDPTPTTPSGPAKPISGSPTRLALPGTASNYKSQPVLKTNNDLGDVTKRKPIPNHLALSTKVKDPKVAEVQQRDKILGNNNNNNRSDVRFRKGLAANAKGAGNLVKKIGAQLLKKQEAPKLGVSVGSDLGGGQVFGGATR